MTNDVLHTRILKTVGTTRGMVVNDLFRILRAEVPTLSEESLAQEIKDLQSQGIVSLEDVTPIHPSFSVYLCKWEYNADFYLLVGLTLAAVFHLYVGPYQYPYVILGWILGLIFVFFAPGYATVTTLSVEGFSPMETVLLSIGLSVVLVMFLGVMLGLAPWGISLVSSTLGLSGYTLFVGLAGRWRRYRSDLS